MRRDEVWRQISAHYRPQEQTGRRSVIIWQSSALIRTLWSILSFHSPPIWIEPGPQAEHAFGKLIGLFAQTLGS